MTVDETQRMETVRRFGSRPFPPRMSAFNKPFWDALNKGRLITTACGNCQRLSFPPKPICRACWSTKMEWSDIPPIGVLYSFTRNHVMPKTFSNDGLQDIGIVDLSNGLRLMCRIIGDYELFKPDTKVEIVVLMYDDGPLFAARPIEQ